MNERTPTLRDIPRYERSSIPDNFFVKNQTPDDPLRHGSTRPVFHDTEARPDDRKIVFKSGDGERFILKCNEVETHSGELVPVNWRSRSVVDLPESSATLRSLFLFIGPRRHPDLRDEPFDFVARLAKTAETYQVFNAMNICSVKMGSFYDRYPAQVLLYAAHNNYPRIFNDAAFHVLTSQNLEDVTPLLPEDYRIKWVGISLPLSYVIALMAILDLNFTTRSNITGAFQSPSELLLLILLCSRDRGVGAFFGSDCWESCGQVILASLAKGVHSLNDLTTTFRSQVEKHLSNCKRCDAFCGDWMAYAETQIAQVAVFSTENDHRLQN
ncbi:hypothetical protein NP233_g2805 [Leucocoprinus birnbaumii]|uniref:Uncharacterized protein n=1 Tax=Leucocoprinus birnbaumii TaxID=56174 RepID=A0AAD5VY81_9AGAR|nr:hypothetical protein NP233_g2805 [Leucocoprinus birnbaumii]